MKFGRKQILGGCGFAAFFSLFLYASVAGSAARPARISDVFNAAEPYAVMAVLPDVPTFMQRLRSGTEMRAFFDSPLGLHFLKSAPLRGAAHLHRLISYAPESWQWNLYTLVTDGPVLYRSHGQKFVLLVALNRKGQLASTLVGGATAQKVGDWFVIASDKDELARQVAYMQKPQQADLPLDRALSQGSALSFDLRFAAAPGGKRSLFRNLVSEVFSVQDFSGCNISITPGANSVQLNGDCTPRSGALPAILGAADETVMAPEYPAYVYYHKAGHKAAHLLSLNGFASDYGNMVPQIFFSGPASDQKAIEFLSQAFKTKAHQLESNANGFVIRYPYAYRYEKRKFDLFAPYLAANRERFFWQTFVPEKKPAESAVAIGGKFGFYAKLDLHTLLRNSQAALKQYDAIYSPGHFNEFRDALAKSLAHLKNSSLRVYSQAEGKNLRLGGTLAFAEN